MKGPQQHKEHPQKFMEEKVGWEKMELRTKEVEDKGGEDKGGEEDTAAGSKYEGEEMQDFRALRLDREERRADDDLSRVDGGVMEEGQSERKIGSAGRG